MSTVVLAAALLAASMVRLHGQESSGPDGPELSRSLSEQSISSFEARVRLPVGLLDHRADETWHTRVVYDGTSTLYLGWLRMGYNQQEQLMVRNLELLMGPDRSRLHRWWIRGSRSASVDAGMSSLSSLFRSTGSGVTDRLRQLLAVLFQTQLVPERMERTDPVIKKTASSYRLSMVLSSGSDREDRRVQIQIDRDRSRVSEVRFVQDYEPSYDRPDQREYILRVEAYHGSSSLPRQMTFVDSEGANHDIRISYNRSSGNSSAWTEPAWVSSDRSSGRSDISDCPGNLFQMARDGSLYEERQYQKRLSVFSGQVERIRNCYNRRSERSSRLTVPEEELMDALRFSNDPTHTPSGFSSTGGKPTAFQTLLRMIRLEKQDRLTSDRLQGISLRPQYSTLIQLLAFRSAVKTISSASAFSEQLQRVSQQQRLRSIRLFVREMEHRLRGIGDQKGVIQEKGKKFLVSVQEEMTTTLSATILMARLYRELGYFEKADAAYAALSKREEMMPAVKGFIRTARMDAVRSLKALDIGQIETRDLLYLSGVQVREGNGSAAFRTFQSFVNEYASSDLSLFLDDIQVVRTVVEQLIKEEKTEVVRRFFRELVRREEGRFTTRSFLSPFVKSVYGPSAKEQYELFRHLRDPRDIEPVMRVSEAVSYARSRVEQGNADRADYRLLARSVPVLLSRETKSVDGLIQQLKQGYHTYASWLLAESIGDLHMVNDETTSARTFYRKAVRERLARLTGGSPDHPPYPVPPYTQPSRFLDSSTEAFVKDAPLLIKLSRTAKGQQALKKARQLLQESVDLVGDRTSWMGHVRDPGIAANYQRQYAAWGLYLLEAPEPAERQLEEGVRREQGRYPYGSFTQSSTHSLYRMRQLRNQTTGALKVLRQASIHERQSDTPYRFEGSAGQTYIQLLTDRNRTDDAIMHLRNTVRTEWLQMAAFSLEGSATGALVDLLTSNDRIDDALEVLKRAFYRSLAETPPYEPGTAPYEYIHALKRYRHAVDALIVARKYGTVYASDPESLSEEIRSLQSRVDSADLVEVFADRVRKATDHSVSERTRTLVRQLVRARPQERTQIEKSLLNREERIIPLLYQTLKEQSSDDLRERLRSMIVSRGWQYVRSMYERPDLLHGSPW